jgi:hypothetical protein
MRWRLKLQRNLSGEQRNYDQPSCFLLIRKTQARAPVPAVFSLFAVGVRVWQKSGSPVRPIINGTINGAGCSPAPPIAMELSGSFLLLTASTPNGPPLAFRSET